MNSFNIKLLATLSVSLALTACGGGGPNIQGCAGGAASAVGSASCLGPGTPAATPAALTAHPLSTPAIPVDELIYPTARNLAGTGIGGSVAPADLRTHYSFPSTLTGAGQTIAIVDAPGHVNAAGVIADLNAFSKQYNLPLTTATTPSWFSHIDLSNGAVPTAANDWASEVALDTQWAHAMAPGANIVLVTAKSNATADLLAAIQDAAAQPGVVAISMSFGMFDQAIETSAAYDGLLQTIQAKGIILFASSGDYGNDNNYLEEWPSVSPYVTSIGGTYIETVAYNLPTITTEIAWIDGGGGASTYEPKPAYQTNALLGTVATIDPTKRAVPDVAYNAAQGSAVATVMGGLWYYEAGTSEGAPQWAAIAALIAQDRANKKETTLQALMKATTNGFNGFLYQAKVDSTGLFNITEGSDQSTLMTTTCAICLAGKGYNAATGFGVPNVTNLLAFF